MGKQHFQGDAWFNEKVSKRTKEALQQKNKQFEREHFGATDEEIAAYLRSCAEKLGHTPNEIEVIGGKFISRRFGGWNKAIEFTQLPKIDRTPRAQENCAIYKEEFKKQTRLFKTERQANTEAKKQAANSSAAEELKIREQRDAEWGAAHEQDSDEQLLEYICKCAAEQGRTPRAKDVLGGLYISGRFGSWGIALVLAGLHIPREVKVPKDSELKAYYKRTGKEQPA